MEVFIAIASGLISILLAVIAWSLTQTLGRINDRITAVEQMASRHIEECNDRISRDEIENRLERVEQEVERSRRFAHWVVNSLTSIAYKMNITLSDSPF